LQYQELISAQRIFFNTGQTRDVTFRIATLKKLRQLIELHEAELYKAIYDDFKKSEFETYGSELSFVYHELRVCINKTRRWSRPRRVFTNLLNIPAKSYIIPEPLGVSLVIGAWNYPYMLSLVPLVSAIAAGNTAIIKPSEIPAKTSRVMANLINDNFPADYLHVVEGGVPETTALLDEKFDKIFFTGSTSVGRIIAQAAAKHLTSVTLELGGKSPTIVTRDTNVKNAARRITWGKFFNSGQSCVAPDYVLIDASIKDEFLNHCVEYIHQFRYAFKNENYVQIINDKNFNRLIGLIEPSKVYFGGESDASERYIAPTIMHNVTFDDKVMEDEIFGPIMPVITYTDLAATVNELKLKPKPLSFYLFTNDPEVRRQVLIDLSFGGGSVNDTMMHLANPHLPFGGIGDSGMGSYHGHRGFEAFSHYKGIHQKPVGWEPALKYPPYSKKKLRMLKWIFNI
jgi:aldehyde dehydrogenase (NAD+)